jgi:hypothetical protein
MVWQKRIPDRYPKVIVTVASDTDVIEAVKLVPLAWIAHLRAPAGIVLDCNLATRRNSRASAGCNSQSEIYNL